MCDALLDAGASVHAVDMSTGRTPLHYAAAQPAVRLPGRAGAAASTDAGGETPISLRGGKIETTRVKPRKHVDAGEWRTTATDQRWRRQLYCRS